MKFKQFHFLRFLCMVIIVFAFGFSSANAEPLSGNKRPNSGGLSDQPVRALHFVLRGVAVDDARRIIKLAGASGFNTVIISLADAVKMPSFPGKPFKNAWTVEEFLSVAHYARQQGLVVIPEVKLLSHQEKFIGASHPEMMFNGKTYDPRNPAVQKVVAAHLNELIALLNPPAILIGHDEVAGFKFRNKLGIERRAWLKKGEQPLPADLFLEDVMRIHSYLKKKGVETWMWGDMLVSPDEFTRMEPGGMHGTIPGYGKALRSKIPKDIVICDWHYKSEHDAFPTLAVFSREGFRVYGATWKTEKTSRNFSKYAAAHGGSGMIATTWFHVQRKEWDVVERIIRESGEIFLRDFPDKKGGL